MTAIPETDGRLPRVVPCAQTKVGPARGQLTVPLDGFSNPDRTHKTTMLAAEPPATVAAIPVKVGSATFDYASVAPGAAAFLRRRAASIRQEVKLTMAAVYQIGADLYGAKLKLRHGQFIEWVELECGFSLRTAENYVRASAFAAEFATVANLSPATVYRLSAKSAPPEVVNDVLARAASGERVSDAEVMRMFRAAKDRKRQLASEETGDKRRRAGPQHEGPSAARAEAKNEIAKANARAKHPWRIRSWATRRRRADRAAAARDGNRLHALTCKRNSPGGSLTDAEDVEEAQLTARFAAYEAESRDRGRLDDLSLQSARLNCFATAVTVVLPNRKKNRSFVRRTLRG